MPITTFALQVGPINVSLQKGDIIYYAPTVNQQAGKNHPTSTINTKPKELGVVVSIDRPLLQITINHVGPMPNLNIMYLFFIKDGEANHSGIIGFFLETEYRNYSKVSSEIFATAADYAESSR